jgi:hypothetical protein
MAPHPSGRSNPHQTIQTARSSEHCQVEAMATNCGSRLAAQHAEAQDDVEVTEFEWKKACAEATAVIHEAVLDINETIDELRYEIADLEGAQC